MYDCRNVETEIDSLWFEIYKLEVHKEIFRMVSREADIIFNFELL
tara:strand:- start:531 stop:665 length:135 start_codon:yes stop_codon:yes gene_type:complete